MAASTAFVLYRRRRASAAKHRAAARRHEATAARCAMRRKPRGDLLQLAKVARAKQTIDAHLSKMHRGRVNAQLPGSKLATLFLCGLREWDHLTCAVLPCLPPNSRSALALTSKCCTMALDRHNSKA